ncbi:hypothetical protein ACHAWF_009702 [Thalassiosira exigua]
MARVATKVRGLAVTAVGLCLNAWGVASFVGPFVGPTVAVQPLSLATSKSAPCRRPVMMALMSQSQSSTVEDVANEDAGIVQTPSLWMDDILKGNSSAASTAVEMLMEVRGTDAMEKYLGDCLPPESSSFPLWAKLPLSRYSRRARQLRLRRLLELSSPTAPSEDDDEASKQRRLRSALFVLLRSMADNPDFKGVSSMLAMAKKGAKVGNMSAEEMLKRTPDLETPKYEVMASRKDGFEVRRYDKFSVCSVTMNKLKSSGSDGESASKLSNPQLSGATSFGALAGYLFGKNEEQTAMKMTTPVLSEGEGADRKMSFVLPSDYWEKEDEAPTPLSDSAVKVSSMDGCERAVLAFGGFGRKNDVDDKTKKLQEMLAADGEWRAVDDAPVILAQYNDPFTPPWNRRNEVSVLVESRG